MSQSFRHLPEGHTARTYGDDEWVEQIRNGSYAAFEALFQVHYQGLCTFVRSYVHSPEVAEELVQDIFFNIWHQRQQWYVRGNLRAYLYGAARNHAAKHARRRGIERRWQMEASQQPKDVRVGPEELLRAKELEAAVRRALNTMPEKRRLSSVVNNAQSLNYVKFDHNTFVNIAGVPGDSWPGAIDTVRAEVFGEQDYGAITFGQTQYLVFRNNLVVNPGFVGGPTNPILQPTYMIDIDSTVVDSVTIVPPLGVDIRNNNIWMDPSIPAVYPDTMEVHGRIDPTLQLFIDAAGTGGTILDEEVNFVSAPDLPLDFIESYLADPAGSDTRILPGDSRENPVVNDLSYYENYYGQFDFAYDTGSASYTGSTQGQPLGDLNWWGMAITPTEDQFTTIITSSEGAADLPTAFQLRGNYPNPFNPSTAITFDLPTAANVSVVVFDVLGRQVMTIRAGALQAGAGQSVRLDAADLASGIYLYQVRAQTPTETLVRSGKMLLVK